MNRYGADQISWRVDGVTVGGQPGEYPVVMIGTMFHPGHRIVSDPRRGSFDKEQAQEQLEREYELSRNTGLPRMTHIVGETVSAMTRYLGFIAEHSSHPIIIDSPSPEVKIEVCDEVASDDLAKRLIYYAITPETDDSELSAARKLGGAICTLYSTERRQRPEKRFELLTQMIMPKVNASGIDRVMIDCGVSDLASLGWTVQTLQRVKEVTGLPAGCAPMHAFHAWRRAARIRPPAADAAAGSSLCLPLFAGADFLFYGPVSNAPWAFPVCGSVTAINAYAGRNVGIRPATRQHPLFQMF